MDIINILETFGIPVAMCVAFCFFIWKQNKFIQDELTKELRESFKRLEDIIIGLINAQKKLQTDFGRELARLEGSYRALANTINKLLEKDRKNDNK